MALIHWEVSGRGLYIHALACLALVWLDHTAMAETQATIPIAAAITAGCQINNVPPANSADIGLIGELDFGSDHALSTSLHSTNLFKNAGLTISCTPGVGVTMRIDGGQNYSSSWALKLAGGSSLLPYQLYSDVDRLQSVVVNQVINMDVSNSANINLPLYGQLVLPGSLPAGNYLDVLTITLEW